MSHPPYPGPPDSGQPYPGRPNPEAPSGQPPFGSPPYGESQHRRGSVYGQAVQPDATQIQYGEPPGYAPPHGQPRYGQEPQYGNLPYGQRSPYGETQVPYGAAQPGYGYPGYGQPGVPLAEPPTSKSKVLPIVLIAVATVLVLGVVGVTALYAIGRRASEVSANTAAPTASASAESTPTPKPVKITVVVPKTLGGRPKVTDAQAAAAVKQVKQGLAKMSGAKRPVGAIYSNAARTNMILMTAAAVPLDDPESFVDMALFGLRSSDLKISGLVKADTGALGGEAKCGSATDNGFKMAICLWADDGSTGMIFWYFRSVTKAKAEFPALRAQIEKKS